MVQELLFDRCFPQVPMVRLYPTLALSLSLVTRSLPQTRQCCFQGLGLVVLL